jgi:hypothetical protein
MSRKEAPRKEASKKEALKLADYAERSVCQTADYD